ncbi:transcription elongation factor [Nibricoccus aquaticus]|uniref:Transcription elongation factor n=1 Tax=Nibricoccus aquaticus TaxID=2576891 RepID=A0A290QEG6_9BACT|nr:GreA/GreB family elongation factor [Nibricoccus aquaticus]ATC65620.1 transcription elongation factor [Nibricoccus aquaticus]
MDKSLLRQAIVAKLTAELDTLTRAALMAREEATSEESKAEGKYDTRGQEAAYLAEGQARLALELQETITTYQALSLREFSPGETIDVGAIVTLKARGKSSAYFLGPRSGGLDFEIDGRALVIVTPQSPLGRQLPGRHVGDTVELPGRGGPVPHQIASIE